MTILQLLVVIVFLGAVLFLIEKAPFVSESVKPTIRWIVLVVIVFVTLKAFGVFEYLGALGGPNGRHL